MKHLPVIAIVAALTAPSVAWAQAAPNGAWSAPVGHRQPTASDVPANDSVRGASMDAPSMQTGRSVRRSDGGTLNDLDNNSDTGPRICTNCDD